MLDNQKWYFRDEWAVENKFMNDQKMRWRTKKNEFQVFVVVVLADVQG